MWIPHWVTRCYMEIWRSKDLARMCFRDPYIIACHSTWFEWVIVLLIGMCKWSELEWMSGISMLTKTHENTCVNWGIVSYMLYGGYVDDNMELNYRNLVSGKNEQARLKTIFLWRAGLQCIVLSIIVLSIQEEFWKENRNNFWVRVLFVELLYLPFVKKNRTKTAIWSFPIFTLMGSVLTTCRGSSYWSCRDDQSAVLSNVDGNGKEPLSLPVGGLSITCFAASFSGSVWWKRLICRYNKMNKPNQDRVLVHYDKNTKSLIIGVFDGHGRKGHLVSQVWR